MSNLDSLTINWSVVLYAAILSILVCLGYHLLQTFIVYTSDYFNRITVVNQYLNNVYYAVSYWTERGCRQYQEDRFTMMKGHGAVDCSLYALFDGHGGSKASQYCNDHLLKYIQSDPNFENNIDAALTNGFRRLDEEFTTIAKRGMLSDGSTAVVAVISNKRIYVANAGDSRAIIVQKGMFFIQSMVFLPYDFHVSYLLKDGKAKAMSVDHKPSREDEARRIDKLGGKVVYYGQWRVQGTFIFFK